MTNPAQRLLACKHFRWMPGMRAVGELRRYPVRLVDCERPFDIDDPPEDWRWWVQADGGDGGPYPGPYLPDLEDPATTLGCLLALVREAWGLPGAFLAYRVGYDDLPDVWRVDGNADTDEAAALIAKVTGSWSDVLGEGASEAEALIAALESAP